MEALLALKSWMISTLPAAIGSAISLYIGKDKTSKMRKAEVLCVFVFGVALAHYFGGATIEYNNIDPNTLTADSIKVSIAVVGMGVLTNIMIQLPIAVEALRKKWIGE